MRRSWGYHQGVATLTFPIDNALAQELGADRDRLLEAVAERAGARVSLRGNEVIAEGSDTAVAQVRLLLEELTGLVEQGLPVGNQTVDAIVGVLDADGRAVDVLHDVVWRHRGKRIAPKTLNQKRYVDAIRSSTVTFGVGPAGTGKTYLAMALAVSALVDREVARIISRALRWRPASGSASCRATCSRRSIPTCARSSTRSTTCSMPTA